MNRAAQISAQDAPDMARFDWDDPLRLEDQLTGDERMLRDAARAYAQSQLQPRVTGAFRDGETPPRAVRRNGRGGTAWHDDSRSLWRAWRRICDIRTGPPGKSSALIPVIVR